MYFYYYSLLVQVYSNSFTDYINYNFGVSRDQFVEAHKNAYIDAYNYYNNNGKLTQQVKLELGETIKKKFEQYAKKRKEFLMVYGQPITIKDMDDLELLDMTVTSVIVEKGACENVTSFDISQCIKLQQLTIGDKNFKNIPSFTIQDLPNLVSITIGNDCFLVTNGSSRCSFSISNCEILKDIVIGRHSFKDYRSFSLSRLNSLESLIIGDICNESSNFINCTFLISGILIIQLNK